MIHETQNAQISHKQDRRNIYAIMKTMCLPSYHHNGFVEIHALGHKMYGYTLLLSMSQRLINMLSKERNLSGCKWSTTDIVLKSYRTKMGLIYMQSWKTMYPHILVITGRAHCFHDCIYITPILFLRNLTMLYVYVEHYVCMCIQTIYVEQYVCICIYIYICMNMCACE